MAKIRISRAAGSADNHDGHQGGGHMKHILMMAACCGLPILLVALLPLFTGLGGGVGTAVRRYAFLLCPIMMIPMMFMMMGGRKAKKDTALLAQNPNSSRESTGD